MRAVSFQESVLERDVGASVSAAVARSVAAHRDECARPVDDAVVARPHTRGHVRLACGLASAHGEGATRAEWRRPGEARLLEPAGDAPGRSPLPRPRSPGPSAAHRGDSTRPVDSAGGAPSHARRCPMGRLARVSRNNLERSPFARARVTIRNVPSGYSEAHSGSFRNGRAGGRLKVVRPVPSGVPDAVSESFWNARTTGSPPRQCHPTCSWEARSLRRARRPRRTRPRTPCAAFQDDSPSAIAKPNGTLTEAPRPHPGRSVPSWLCRLVRETGWNDSYGHSSRHDGRTFQSVSHRASGNSFIGRTGLSASTRAVANRVSACPGTGPPRARRRREPQPDRLRPRAARLGTRYRSITTRSGPDAPERVVLC